MSEREESSEQAPSGLPGYTRYSSVISTRPKPLDMQRPPPWNRWFHKFVHYWRYGYSHPDEDLLGVIEAIGDSLHVQVISARAVLTGNRAREADVIRAELNAELARPLPDFSTLLSIESRINALYPPALARRRQWVIRERFRRVAAPEAVQSWQLARLRSEMAPAPAGAEVDAAAGDSAASPEPEPPGGDGADSSEPQPPADDSGQDSLPGGGSGGDGNGGGGGEPAPAPPPAPQTEPETDAQTLLGYIHTSYLMTIGREKAVRDLKRWLLMRFWLFILVLVPLLFGVWLVLWVNAMGQYWGLLLGLFLIAAAGRAGATTSIIRRLQAAISNNVLAADPVIELTALRTGKNEISMALVSSSIFALLMWAFFASGIPHLVGLQGGLFPRPIAAEQIDDLGRVRAAQDEDAAPDAEAGAGAAADPDADKDEDGAAAAADDPQQNGVADQAEPPPAADAPAAEAPGEADAPAAVDAPAPPQPARPGFPPAADALLRRAQVAVTRHELAYHDQMSRLVAADGLFNWPQRRRIRQRARRAIGAAIVAQQYVIYLVEAAQREARAAGNSEAAQGWEAELAEANARKTALNGLGAHPETGGKPPPGLTCERGELCNPFPALANHLRLADEADFFKMLLWAFIAGFAERFVPDMLDRVVSRTRGTARDDSATLIAATARGRAAPPSPPPSGDGDEADRT